MCVGFALLSFSARDKTIAFTNKFKRVYKCASCNGNGTWHVIARKLDYGEDQWQIVNSPLRADINKGQQYRSTIPLIKTGQQYRSTKNVKKTAQQNLSKKNVYST